MGLAGGQHEERLEGDFLEAVPLLFYPKNLNHFWYVGFPPGRARSRARGRRTTLGSLPARRQQARGREPVAMMQGRRYLRQSANSSTWFAIVIGGGTTAKLSCYQSAWSQSLLSISASFRTRRQSLTTISLP